MDIKGLHYFIMAAERLNFTVAAKECYITQTAMSLHIKKMEGELGVKLFDRNKHTTKLTRAGEDFYVRACALVSEYESAVKHARSVADGIDGIIGILVPGCIEGFMLMEKLREFRKLYPGVQTNIFVDTLGRHVGRLKMGNVDVSIGPPEETELDSAFTVETLREDPIVAVLSSNHPLANRDFLTSEMLKPETAILCGYEDDSTSFRVVRGNTAFPGFESKSIIMANNFNELMFLVELNRGISFMPEFANMRITPDNSGVVFKPCIIENAPEGSPPPTVLTTVTYMKKNTNPALEPFLDVLLDR